MSVRELLRSRPARLLLEAHRGGAGGQPLTLDVLQRSHSEGADFLELDVQFTSDRVGVIQHDFMTAEGTVLSANPIGHVRRELDDLVTLSEVLGFSRDTGARLSLDLKTGHGSASWWIGALIQEIQHHGVEEQVLVLAWDHRMLRELRSQAPDVAQRALIKANLTCFPAFLAATDVDAVSLSYDLIEREDVDAAHARGVAVAMVEMWRLDLARATEVDADMVSWSDVRAAAKALRAGLYTPPTAV